MCLPRVFTAGIFSFVLLASPASAGDAYDDDQQERVPEDFEQEDSEDPERVGDALNAGGLQAPDSIPEGGDKRSDIEKDLDEAQEKDAGRGLEFVWLNAELGLQVASLTSLKNNSLLSDEDVKTGVGYLVGAGLGVRVLYFTLGGRFRYGGLGAFDILSVSGEAGLRVPLGIFEPYVTLGGGYVGVSGFDLAREVPNVGGLDVRLGAGLDLYFSDSFSLGAQVGGNVLFLSRSAEPGACEVVADCVYAEKGKALGTALTATFVAGLHF